MAVEPQKPKSRKKQPIEPLDWSMMSQSPALKGMVSFLEVTPEDIRRQQGRNGDTRISSDSSTGSEARIRSVKPGLPRNSHFASGSESLTGDEPHTVRDTRTAIDTLTGSDSRLGSESSTGANSVDQDREDLQTLPSLEIVHRSSGSEPRTGSETRIDGDARTGPDVAAPRPSSHNSLSTSTPVRAINHPEVKRSSEDTRAVEVSEPMKRTAALRDSPAEGNFHTSIEPPIGSDSQTGSDSHTGLDSRIGNAIEKVDGALAAEGERRIGSRTMSDSRTGGQQKSTYFAGQDQYPRPQRRLPMLQGEVVWQNRKIRKCVLAQDAHSQGEDALFSAMWNAAKPDATDPAGSRTLRIGYAELAQKSRMHRSNIRINIAGLRAKLAIEVLDEHDSRDVMPRLYRLYSYKEILERRKAAGLEYVIRKKSVVFVTETGELVTLPGLAKTGARKVQKRADTNNEEHYDQPAQEARAEQLDLDVKQISEAMSQHWPVDEAAAQQLLRQCRGTRRDAEIDEIVFFVNEKLQIALTNNSIKNPTGLILATVPQCFEGTTFQEFRRRRNEALRLAAEEQERKRQQERELQAWLDGRLLELKAMAEDETQPGPVREKALRELRQYNG